jgi:DNA polymerase-3 subunit alpha
VKESKDPKIKLLVDASMVLEGMNRNAGMHAAGVVIAPGAISDFAPLYKTPQTETMTQYNMKDLETVGLLKMDFLGLRTLTVIENALRLIEENHGIAIDPDAVPEDDAATFELFGRGDTVGVFQFESAGMQDWLRKLKPTSISDLVAMNALYRPGPMDMIGDFIARKHGQQSIVSIHPSLEPILRETYGVIVYQEQVMKIASEVAGFTLARADLMRRAMGKKDKALMATMKQEFVEGAVGRGVAKKIAGEIFDLIEKFASYGFNKSHSVAYSVIAYQTAYLKAHYPAEFMAATLSSEMGDTDRIVKLIDDCRRLGIRVLPPDVNQSGKDFNVIGADIRFGLCAIKNVGESAVESVLRSRVELGQFENSFDFCRRVDLRLVNKKCLESLVQAGAFDSMGGTRAQQFDNIERATAFGAAAQQQGTLGQETLFASSGSQTAAALRFPTLLPAEGWTDLDSLTREKSVLGFYVSGHPLLRYEREISEFANVRFGDVTGFKSGGTARACGVVSSIKKKIDKRGNTMAFITLEDFSGKGECIVFSEPFGKYQQLLKPDAMVMVIGKGEVNVDTLKIVVSEVVPMDRVREKFARGVVLSIDADRIEESAIVRLRQIMEEHRGNVPCYFNVLHHSATSMFLTRRFTVDPSERFVEQISGTLGPSSIRFSGDGSLKHLS